MYHNHHTSVLSPTTLLQGEEEEEEDPVDPQEVLREKCGATAKCTALQETLDTCNARVSGKTKTTETCEQELYDFVHCVDHCVSSHLTLKIVDFSYTFDFGVCIL